MNALLALPTRKKTIGLTALIDVVFILLLFFMLTTTFTHQESIVLRSSLNESQSSESVEKTNYIFLRQDGSFFVTQDNVLPSEKRFHRNMQALLSRIDTGLNTLVIPQQETRMEIVIKLIETLNEGGVTRAALAKSTGDL